MVIRTNVILFVAFIASGMHAQPLVEQGGGVGLQGVTYMLADEAQDRLLLTGGFAYANGVQVSPGIIEWSASEFVSIGCGVAWDCVSFINEAGLQNKAQTIAIWENELYVGGDFFYTRDGVEVTSIMRWSGETWLPVGHFDSAIKSLKVIDGELIAAGWFTYADTVLANGLARWDGERWHRVVDVPAFYIGDGPNQIQDVEKYQGQWYIGGNLPLVSDLARWNGASWETVGNGFTGPYSQVNKLRIHDDRLYVVGSFSHCPPLGNPSNAGSGILAWDGATWDQLGGGTCGATNPAVIGITWWRDTLHIAGLFDRVGGEPVGKLARWDGTEWCALAPLNYFGSGSPGALAVFHDSLYVGGSFLEAGGYAVSCFGKWVGGGDPYACGMLADIQEQDHVGFSVYPNPTNDLLNVTLPPGTITLLVLDVLGREVLREKASATVGVETLLPGSYVLRALDAHGDQLGQTRFIRE